MINILQSHLGENQLQLKFGSLSSKVPLKEKKQQLLKQIIETDYFYFKHQNYCSQINQNKILTFSHIHSNIEGRNWLFIQISRVSGDSTSTKIKKRIVKDKQPFKLNYINQDNPKK